jgi:hypothetical protein
MFKTGTRHFVGQNPSRQAAVDFLLAQKAAKLSLKILDPYGNVVRDFDVSKEKEAGFHRIAWDLVSGPAPKEKTSKPAFTPYAQPVKPGIYVLALEVDGAAYQRLLTVEPDPRTRTAGTFVNEAEELRRWLGQQP